MVLTTLLTHRPLNPWLLNTVLFHAGIVFIRAASGIPTGQLPTWSTHPLPIYVSIIFVSSRLCWPLAACGLTLGLATTIGRWALAFWPLAACGFPHRPFYISTHLRHLVSSGPANSHFHQVLVIFRQYFHRSNWRTKESHKFVPGTEVYEGHRMAFGGLRGSPRPMICRTSVCWPAGLCHLASPWHHHSSMLHRGVVSAGKSVFSSIVVLRLKTFCQRKHSHTSASFLGTGAGRDSETRTGLQSKGTQALVSASAHADRYE